MSKQKYIQQSELTKSYEDIKEAHYKKIEKDYQEADTTRTVVLLGVPLLLFIVMFSFIVGR
jgi:hypothetical protein